MKDKLDTPSGGVIIDYEDDDKNAREEIRHLIRRFGNIVFTDGRVKELRKGINLFGSHDSLVALMKPNNNDGQDDIMCVFRIGERTSISKLDLADMEDILNGVRKYLGKQLNPFINIELDFTINIPFPKAVDVAYEMANSSRYQYNDLDSQALMDITDIEPKDDTAKQNNERAIILVAEYFLTDYLDFWQGETENSNVTVTYKDGKKKILRKN